MPKTKPKTIKYHFVGDGSQVISDAPSEDITDEMWAALPKHIQRSIAASPLYEKAKPGTKQEPEEPEPEPEAAAKPEEPGTRAKAEPKPEAPAKDREGSRK